VREIVEHLLKAPDHQLDEQMKLLIEKWQEPPTALQVLEVLDCCIYGSLASGFIVSVLQALYDIRCKKEGTTHEEVQKLAVWRKQL
jgi:hypothetical protein